MKIFLHIGLGKVGSTTIQRFLDLNSPQLEKLGLMTSNYLGKSNNWKLPAYCGYPGTEEYFSSSARKFLPGEMGTFIDKFERDWQEELANFHDEQSIIVSSEFLCYYCSDEKSINRLRKILIQNFSEVKIIYYCRDQVDLVKSIYAQGIIGLEAKTQSYRDYIKEVSINDIYLNFYSGLSIWADVFGEENISAGVMGRNGCIGVKLIHDFLARVDLDGHIEKFDFSGCISNKSPGFFHLEMARLNNKINPRIKYNGSINKYRNMVNAMIKSGRIGNFGAFPKSYDAEIFSKFDEANILFAEKFLNSSKNPFPQINTESYERELALNCLAVSIAQIQYTKTKLQYEASTWQLTSVLESMA